MGKSRKQKTVNDTNKILNLLLLSYWDNIYTGYLNSGKEKNKAKGAQF
jgi:hypothetical protein